MELPADCLPPGGYGDCLRIPAPAGAGGASSHHPTVRPGSLGGALRFVRSAHGARAFRGTAEVEYPAAEIGGRRGFCTAGIPSRAGSDDVSDHRRDDGGTRSESSGTVVARGGAGRFVRARWLHFNDAVHGKEFLNVGMGTLLELGSGAEEDHTTVIKEDHSVGDFVHQVEIVCDHDAGELELPLEAKHEVAEVI